MTEVLSEELKKLHTCQTERMKLKKKTFPRLGRKCPEAGWYAKKAGSKIPSFWLLLYT